MKYLLLFFISACLLLFSGCESEKTSSESKEAVAKQHEGHKCSKHNADSSAKPLCSKICKKCGEIKGSGVCCKLEGHKKCTKGDLQKDSTACCKHSKCKNVAIICLKCGELKGTDKCCNIEGREKCPKCGLLKGSIGCCRLKAS
ncbi:MAG: hypothetical protein HQK83_00050 [Fibrobacteria bacterium]|nr:hypothetical protein [Fibrobacteria bacterium]